MPFKLRYPYRPLHWVTDLDQPVSAPMDPFRVSIRAEKPYIVIDIEAFDTEEEALGFAPRIWNALGLLAVQKNTGFVVEPSPTNVEMCDDPEAAGQNLARLLKVPYTGPVHGTVGSQQPVAIPMGQNIRVLRIGDFTGSVTWPAQKYVEPLLANLKSVTDGAPYADQRLRMAIELLSESQREVSLRSKFLTLMIALEVLAEPLAKHDIALRHLEKLDKEILTELEGRTENSEERHALESLRRELIFRRNDSLRSSLRKLVLNTMTTLPDAERTERAKAIVAAYDKRGTLVHNGYLSAAELHTAHDTTLRVLLGVLAVKLGTSTNM